MLADIVADLQYGDCGKGKVTHYLCGKENYSHVIHYNRGCNAEHTIYHNRRKFITHHVPVSVFFGIKSIIGNGCVVYPRHFFKEIHELEEGGIKTKDFVYVAGKARAITEKYLEEDKI